MTKLSFSMGKHLYHFTKNSFMSRPCQKLFPSPDISKDMRWSVYTIKECLKTHCHVRRAVSNFFSTIESKKIQRTYFRFFQSVPFFPSFTLFLFLLLGCFVVVVVVAVVVMVVVGSDDGEYTSGVVMIGRWYSRQPHCEKRFVEFTVRSGHVTA